MGGVGLVAFAGVCWWLIPRYPELPALVGATIIWLLVPLSAWTLGHLRRRLL
jgi:hypothetical protein